MKSYQRAALVLAGAGLASAACFTEDKCIFHQYDNGDITYSWDLRSLCKSSGNEYTWTDTQNHTYRWNICGTVDQKCTPPWTVYVSQGVVTQFWTETPPCPTPPDGTCIDPDTKKAVCCTGKCAVLAHDMPCNYQLIDPTNPATGGITWAHAGMPPDSSDPNQCKQDPTTGCATERSIAIKMYCDPSGSPTADPTFLGVSEPTQCVYLMELKHVSACGTTGDPFDAKLYSKYEDSPGKNFGYTILGMVLLVAFTQIYSFGDGKGWWDPIKSRLPSVTLPFIGTIGGTKGGVYGGAGGSGYKQVSNTTPITASAYGST